MNTSSAKRLKDGVLVLCDITSNSCDISEAEARRLHAQAFATMDSADLSVGTFERLSDYANALLDGHIGMARRMRSGDALMARVRGQRSWTSFYNQRNEASALLRDAWKALRPPAPHPDGYTTTELKDQAGIRKTLWQRIRTEAKLSSPRGRVNHKFSNSDIRALIAAARSIDTVKTRQAAEAWEKTLAEWEVFVSTA